LGRVLDIRVEGARELLSAGERVWLSRCLDCGYSTLIDSEAEACPRCGSPRVESRRVGEEDLG